MHKHTQSQSHTHMHTLSLSNTQVQIGIDPEDCFNGAEWALMVGAKPRGPGMERADLLTGNGEIFQLQGRALNESAHENCKVWVSPGRGMDREIFRGHALNSRATCCGVDGSVTAWHDMGHRRWNHNLRANALHNSTGRQCPCE